MSSLYFRGKLAYAATFSDDSTAIPGTWIITSSRGLLRPETIVRLRELEEISSQRILADNPKYRDSAIYLKITDAKGTTGELRRIRIPVSGKASYH